MNHIASDSETPLAVRLPDRLNGSVTRRGSNLAIALIFLPASSRRDAFLFHDFCRTVDDIADSTISTPQEKHSLLNAWLAALQAENERALPSDFLEMIVRRRLDRHLLTEILRGMLMDTNQNRYVTFTELRLYCWRVAAAVGRVSAELFGAQSLAVHRYAEELGISLQLTNILRDVAEDASINRIYLPLEDLERFGVTEQEILERHPSPAMTHLLNFQAERADACFARAEDAWAAITASERRLMRPARLMSAIYRDLLLQMHRDRYDVFAKKYRVSTSKKILLMLRVLSSKN
jgi:phytoene synthase